MLEPLHALTGLSPATSRSPDSALSGNFAQQFQALMQPPEAIDPTGPLEASGLGLQAPANTQALDAQVLSGLVGSTSANGADEASDDE